MRHRFFAETLSKNALVEVSWTFWLTFLFFWEVMEMSRRRKGEKEEEGGEGGRGGRGRGDERNRVSTPSRAKPQAVHHVASPLEIQQDRTFAFFVSKK